MADSPLSPRRDHCVERPSIVTHSLGKRACEAKMLPVRFWHARQWQMEMRTGSPSQVRRSCPQLHDAVRPVMRPILKRARPERKAITANGRIEAASRGRAAACPD
jgi:hypothetical protein